jgi:hypothetical protein
LCRISQLATPENCVRKPEPGSADEQVVLQLQALSVAVAGDNHGADQRRVAELAARDAEQAAPEALDRVRVKLAALDDVVERAVLDDDLAAAVGAADEELDRVLALNVSKTQRWNSKLSPGSIV